MAAVAGIILITGAGAGQAAAQSDGRPGPFVVDVRGVTSNLPKEAAFFPVLPTDTFIPSRGFGAEAGIHVYFWSMGPSRLGLGVNVLRFRGTSSPMPIGAVSAGSSSEPFLSAGIHATATTVAPQVSFNFGTRSGWSYLSAGAGRGKLVTTALQAGKPDATRSSGQVTSINVGGGARWFLARHFAIGFDVRVHRLARGSGAAPTPATTLLVAAAGVSLR